MPYLVSSTKDIFNRLCLAILFWLVIITTYCQLESAF